jgi:hypothetical protein
MPRLKPVLISFAVFLAIFLITHAVDFPGSLTRLMQITHGQAILDLEPSFSSLDTYQRLQDFGAVGRSAYLQTMLSIDTIFPISAFAFLYLLSRFTAARAGLSTLATRGLKAFSVAYLTLDLLENLTVVVLLMNYPDRLELLAANIGYLSVGKRASMLMALALPLLVLAYAHIARRMATRRRIPT